MYSSIEYLYHIILMKYYYYFPPQPLTAVYMIVDKDNGLLSDDAGNSVYLDADHIDADN